MTRVRAPHLTPVPGPLPPARVDPWMSIADIAAELRVSKMTVYRLVETGDLRSTRVGRGLRVRRSWFDAYLRARTTGGAA